MRIFDPHVHMTSRTTDDYEAMAASGVKAIVEPASGTAPTPELADELTAFCHTKLAKFKCPRSIDVVDHLPRDDNGKMYRLRLLEKYRSNNGKSGSAL